MNCYKHTDIESYSTCSVCGVGLCDDCDMKYDTPMCDSCATEGTKNTKVKFALGVGLGLLFVYSFMDSFTNGYTSSIFFSAGMFIGSIVVTYLSFFVGFSLSRGLEDFKLAWNYDILQKMRSDNKHKEQKELANNGRTNFIIVKLWGFLFFLVLFIPAVAFYSTGSFIREIKELKN